MGITDFTNGTSSPTLSSERELPLRDASQVPFRSELIDLHNNPVNRYYNPHFTKEETGSERLSNILEDTLIKRYQDTSVPVLALPLRRVIEGAGGEVGSHLHLIVGAQRGFTTRSEGHHPPEPMESVTNQSTPHSLRPFSSRGWEAKLLCHLWTPGVSLT